MSNLRFYLRQAVSNSLRNRQRTLFVLFCIAVGVAAVVSLRSVGLMIGAGLTRNLQADLRGDLVLTPPLVDERFGQTDIDRSLAEEGSELGGRSFSESGVERIRAWLVDRGARVQLGVRHQKPISVFRSEGGAEGGAGGAAGTTSNGDSPPAVAAVSFFVEPESYPFYGSLEMVEPAGLPLAEALASPLPGPHHAVIGRRLAVALEVSVGDRLQVRGAEPFVVGGILADAADARMREIEGVILPFLLLPYESAVSDLGAHADTIYVALPEGANAAADLGTLTKELKEAFRGVEVVSSEDLREQNRELSDRVTQLITTMGLVSLLIGGIGIINTMLVVVGRRTLEISVLKTLGLQGRQITVMFLVEGLLLGIVGSALGVALGLGLLGVLQGVAERVFVQTLEFQLFPEALAMGFVMGVVVTLVFGFLPTLAAGKVRPAVVLQPDLAGLPKAGRALSALVVVLLTAVIGLLVGQIIGHLGVGMGIAFAAMAGLGILTLVFRLLVVVLAKLPSFGSISIKLTQRALAGHSGRVASTLLALVVGMFALSSILLMTHTFLNLIQDVVKTRLGGELIVIPRSLEASRAAAAAIEGLEGVESVKHSILYGARVVAINGDRDMAALEEAAYIQSQKAATKGGTEGPEEEAAEEEAEAEAGPGEESSSEERSAEAEGEAAGGKRVDGKRFVLKDFLAKLSVAPRAELDEQDADYQIAEGVDLEAVAESGASGAAASPTDGSIVLRPGRATEWLGLEVGDTLTLAFSEEGAAEAPAESASRLERTVTIVGFIAEPPEDEMHVRVGDPPRVIAGPGAVPDEAVATPTPFILDLEDDQIQPALRALSIIPGVFALEVKVINSILTALFDKITALPLVIAVLALFAAGVIIANSVSLAVLERRRQIGIMKAIGLQSSQVLRLLLIENGFVGLAGGVIGCGIGASLILALGVLSESPGSFPWWTLVGLVALSVAIALAATLLTAWGASRERPLIVLRYE